MTGVIEEINSQGWILMGVQGQQIYLHVSLPVQLSFEKVGIY